MFINDLPQLLFSYAVVFSSFVYPDGEFQICRHVWFNRRVIQLLLLYENCHISASFPELSAYVVCVKHDSKSLMVSSISFTLFHANSFSDLLSDIAQSSNSRILFFLSKYITSESTFAVLCFIVYTYVFKRRKLFVIFCVKCVCCFYVKYRV